MSGLYNAVFGVDPLAGALLHELNIHPNSVPRFRDCFLFHDGQSIVIYTRTGGGNRAEYEEQNREMTTRAGYLRDEDCSADSTYALFHFRVPEEVKKRVPELLEKGYGVNPSERWKQALEALKNGGVPNTSGG